MSHDNCVFFCSTMSTTEGGRKVTAAVASTGRAVATTSRAVGGALSQARGALSGWWSALTAPAPGAPDVPDLADADADVHTPEDAAGSDAEDAAEELDRDNRTQLRPVTPEPPDKSIDDNTISLNKIQVI